MWRRSPSLNSRTAFCCASAEKLPDRQVGQREMVQDGAEPGVPERLDSEFLRGLAGCHPGDELAEPGGVQGGAQPVQLGELGQGSAVGVELVQDVLAVLGRHPGQAGPC